MNESRWLSSSDPHEMLLFLRGRDERKRRLFACACCRRVWDLLDDRHRMALEVAERFADGLADEEERSALAYLVDGADEDETVDLDSPQHLAGVAVSWAVRSDQEDEELFDPDTEDSAIFAARCAASAARSKEEAAVQCELLRDIFGNPFRVSAIGANVLEWRDGAIVKMARAIYDERRFTDLAVLADALEEAGVCDRDLLEHCRAPGPHVRGCWVVDLLLQG